MNSPASPLPNVFLVDGLVMGMRTVQMVQMRHQVIVEPELVIQASSVVEVRLGSVSLNHGCVTSMKIVQMDQMRRTVRKRRSVRLEGLPVQMGCAHKTPGNVMAKMIVEMVVMKRVVAM